MPAEIREMTGWTFGPLTHELRDPQSPVRRFFATRFAEGAAGIQDRFRAALPAMMVPRATGDHATLGTAGDWLLRYLVHPAVDRVALGGLSSSVASSASRGMPSTTGMTTTDAAASAPKAITPPPGWVSVVTPHAARSPSVPVEVDEHGTHRDRATRDITDSTSSAAP